MRYEELRRVSDLTSRLIKTKRKLARLERELSDILKGNGNHDVKPQKKFDADAFRRSVSRGMRRYWTNLPTEQKQERANRVSERMKMYWANRRAGVTA